MVCRHLERLEDPLEEDEVGVVDLWLLCDVLDFHFCLLVLLLVLLLLLLAALLLLLLLLCLLLLFLGTLLLAPLLAVSAPAVFLPGKLGYELKDSSSNDTRMCVKTGCNSEAASSKQ